MVLTKSQAKLQRGDKAPDFQLQGIDGKTLSLSDFSGREGLLIIFMCNHCPYVKAKMEDIVKLHEKFGDKIALLGINSNDPKCPGEGMKNMKAFAQEYGVLFPYVLDDMQEVAKKYGATCTPDPFLFDQDMKLVFHGRINDALEPGDEVKENTMDETIQQMLEANRIGTQVRVYSPAPGVGVAEADHGPFTVGTGTG